MTADHRPITLRNALASQAPSIHALRPAERGRGERVLAPARQDRPDAILVIDNLAAPKAQAVHEALARAGLAHRYLPPPIKSGAGSSRRS
jgi:transposase InsO family protein